jgi:hypothetical protein
MSTLSYLRGRVQANERRLRYLKQSDNPDSAWQKTTKRLANLRDALGREESRLYTDPAAKL